METFHLLDGALVHRHVLASRFFSESKAPWFAALLPQAELALAGPILIARSRVPTAQFEVVNTELQKLATSFANRQHWSFIDSELTFGALADHLRAFVYFGDSTGEPYGLRLADNRVLSYLPDILTTTQWDALTAPMEQWQIHDRSGIRHELALSDTRRQQQQAPAFLNLSDDQIEKLINAGEPDALLARLELTPETMEAREMKKCHALAQFCVAQWQAGACTDRGALLIFARRIFASNSAVIADPTRVQRLLRSAIEAVQ